MEQNLQRNNQIPCAAATPKKKKFHNKANFQTTKTLTRRHLTKVPSVRPAPKCVRNWLNQPNFWPFFATKAANCVRFTRPRSQHSPDGAGPWTAPQLPAGHKVGVFDGLDHTTAAFEDLAVPADTKRVRLRIGAGHVEIANVEEIAGDRHGGTP